MFLIINFDFKKEKLFEAIKTDKNETGAVFSRGSVSNLHDFSCQNILNVYVMNLTVYKQMFGPDGFFESGGWSFLDPESDGEEDDDTDDEDENFEVGMGLILDGSLEHTAQRTYERKDLFRFAKGIWLNQKSRQMRFFFSKKTNFS